ncbi:Ser-Thr-rich glycosyl-phosphatidyl-inositol-anchored membrane family-domain-containing protein, partial [Russula compacta]
MHSLFTLISLVASACAYQITSPNNVSGWTTGGPNTLAWQRVDTDPTNFTLLLVNQDKSALPTGQEILVAQVDGTTGSLTVPAPSSGFPVGSGYQVNFVKDPQDLNTILAQSNQFNITSSTGTTTTSQSNTA